MKCSRQLLTKGIQNSQNNLGYLFEEGIGTKKDLKQAFAWYKRSAEFNNPSGLCNLAHLYEHGLGVAANLDEAMNLYEKAALLGNKTAKQNLLAFEFERQRTWKLKGIEVAETGSPGAKSAAAQNAPLALVYKPAGKRAIYQTPGAAKAAEKPLIASSVAAGARTASPTAAGAAARTTASPTAAAGKPPASEVKATATGKTAQDKAGAAKVLAGSKVNHDESAPAVSKAVTADAKAAVKKDGADTRKGEANLAATSAVEGSQASGATTPESAQSDAGLNAGSPALTAILRRLSKGTSLEQPATAGGTTPQTASDQSATVQTMSAQSGGAAAQAAPAQSASAAQTTSSQTGDPATSSKPSGAKAQEANGKPVSSAGTVASAQSGGTVTTQASSVRPGSAEKQSTASAEQKVAETNVSADNKKSDETISAVVSKRVARDENVVEAKPASPGLADSKAETTKTVAIAKAADTQTTDAKVAESKVSTSKPAETKVENATTKEVGNATTSIASVSTTKSATTAATTAAQTSSATANTVAKPTSANKSATTITARAANSTTAVKKVEPGKASEKSALAIDKPVRDKWALIVGITDFQDPKIPTLKYAAKDATDFYNYLVKEANFAPDHVRVLLNDKAAQRGILSDLGSKFLARVVKPDDLVVLYFSTHGSPAQLDPRGKSYLVAADSDPNDLFATGIEMQKLLDSIQGRVLTDRVLLVLDACHSGFAGTGAKGVGRTGNFKIADLVQGSGQLVICSSSEEERSWESTRYHNGVFTRKFLEGLRSKGPKTTLVEAYNYAKDAVGNEVREDRPDAVQTPLLMGKWDGKDLIMAIRPAAPQAVPASVAETVGTDSRTDLVTMAPSSSKEIAEVDEAPQSKPAEDEAPARGVLYLDKQFFSVSGNPKELAKEYYDAIKNNRSDPDLYFMRGKALIQCGDWNAALNAFNEAVQLSPNRAHYYLARAYAYFRLGKRILAQQDLEQAKFFDRRLAENIKFNM